MVDISFENSHESSFQISFEDQFDSMLEDILFGKHFDDRHVIEYVEGCNTFYDLVVEYMDRFFGWESLLCVHNK